MHPALLFGSEIIPLLTYRKRLNIFYRPQTTLDPAQMLSVDSLTKFFDSTKAVDDVSFTAKPGEILGLVGPNGAGKTTTLRCLCGILMPDGGSVTVNGHDLLTDDIAAKRCLAFIPETPNHYDLLTVREQLRFVAMCFDTMDEYERLSGELLDRYGLREKEYALVAELSKGMKQKLAIASAMIHRATVFLCDEPMIGLDPQGQHSFKAELQNLRAQNCSIVVSTHLLESAEALCDRLIIMQKGRKLFEGTMNELRVKTDMHAQKLEEIFLALTSGEHS
jgi:ABC-2 type transport system ATP-binding protein